MQFRKKSAIKQTRNLDYEEPRKEQIFQKNKVKANNIGKYHKARAINHFRG